MWFLIHLSRDGLGISHLFFADDVFLFCKARNSQVWLVLEALNSFCATSGLKVNLEKSRTMCSKNLSSRRKDNMTNISSICFTSDLGKYLGFPLIQGRVSKALFADLMTKVQSRLASWNGRLLN